ncbi:MAG: aldo/keto reductase [Spirochaetales bacterium]|nr:aldo/keto reductase [Spirochaetales bacterium]
MQNEKCSIPKFCIGTWQLSDTYWGDQKHSDSLKTIHAAIREGFTFFDTSPVYGKGQSEQLLGQQLNKSLENIIISTKSFVKSPESTIKTLNNSLKRLNREYIDIFFIHWPSTKLDSRPMMELLQKMKEDGKIKKIGVSNFNLNELKKIEESGKVDIIQNGYNLFWRKEEEYIKYCFNNGICTQIYSPLGQGILTGKFARNSPYLGNDSRHLMLLFDSKNIDKIYNYIETLKEICKKYDTSLYDAVIMWTKSLYFIDSIVIGCRKRNHVEELSISSKKSINENLVNELTEFSDHIMNNIVGGTNIFNHSY